MIKSIDYIKYKKIAAEVAYLHIYPNYEEYENYIKLENGLYVKTLTDCEEELDGCPISLTKEAQNFVNTYKIPKKRKKIESIERLKINEQFQDYQDVIRWHTKILLNREKRKPFIYIRDKNNKLIKHELAMKGTYKYQMKMNRKILKDVAVLQETCKNFYFLTITYDVKSNKENKIEAWKHFRSELSYVIEKIRRKYKSEYVGVIESTEKGYPHAHLVLGCEQKLHPEYLKIYGGRTIKTGKAVNFLKSVLWDIKTRTKITKRIGMFNLKYAEPKNLAGYIAKYIAKANKEENLLQAMKETKFNKATKKNILSQTMPIIANVRSYSASKTISKQGRYEIAVENADSLLKKGLITEEEHQRKITKAMNIWQKENNEYLDLDIEEIKKTVSFYQENRVNRGLQKVPEDLATLYYFLWEWKHLFLIKKKSKSYCDKYKCMKLVQNERNLRLEVKRKYKKTDENEIDNIIFKRYGKDLSCKGCPLERELDVETLSLLESEYWFEDIILYENPKGQRSRIQTKYATLLAKPLTRPKRYLNLISDKKNVTKESPLKQETEKKSNVEKLLEYF